MIRSTARALWLYRSVRCIVYISVAFLVLFGLSLITVYEPTDYTCLHCRAHKCDHWLLGLRWNTVRDTEFTPWYQANYQMHEHVWVWNGGTAGISAIGTTTYFACGRRHPIHELPPEWELKLAKRAPEQFAHLYRGVTSSDKNDQERAVGEAFHYVIRNLLFDRGDKSRGDAESGD